MSTSEPCRELHPISGRSSPGVFILGVTRHRFLPFDQPPSKHVICRLSLGHQQLRDVSTNQPKFLRESIKTYIIPMQAY